MAKTGYSQSRISTMKYDPDFKVLITHYRNKINKIQDEVDRDGYATFVAVREEATSVLLDRIMDEPDKIPTPLLADISLRYGDRTGLAAVSKTVNGTVDLNRLAESLAAGRQRAERLSVVDVVPTHLTSTQGPEEIMPSPPSPPVQVLEGRDE